jgi:hypothetical protein
LFRQGAGLEPAAESHRPPIILTMDPCCHYRQAISHGLSTLWRGVRLKSPLKIFAHLDGRAGSGMESPGLDARRAFRRVIADAANGLRQTFLAGSALPLRSLRPPLRDPHFPPPDPWRPRLLQPPSLKKRRKCRNAPDCQAALRAPCLSSRPARAPVADRRKPDHSH